MFHVEHQGGSDLEPIENRHIFLDPIKIKFIWQLGEVISQKLFDLIRNFTNLRLRNGRVASKRQ